MMENLVMIVGLVITVCAGVAHIKWQLNEIKKIESKFDAQKQNKPCDECFDAPCLGC